jgi:hypothetical protein
MNSRVTRALATAGLFSFYDKTADEGGFAGFNV